MTKKELYTTLINIVEATEREDKEELVEKLNHEIELVSRSRTTGEKAKAKIEADRALTDIIKAVLADGTARTVSEIQVADDRLSLKEGISNSKITSLLTKAVVGGEITRTKDKKKTYYSIG